MIPGREGWEQLRLSTESIRREGAKRPYAAWAVVWQSSQAGFTYLEYTPDVRLHTGSLCAA
jgi:hypothetical protein